MKSALFFLVLCFSAFDLFAQSNTTIGLNNSTIIQQGVGLGSVIAVVTSWSRNGSVLWAILHGIFGWLYVIYFVLTRE